MRVVFVAPYEEFALGIRSLSAFLKARGHEVYRIFLKTVAEVNSWELIRVQEGAEDVGARGFFKHPCRVTEREADLLVRKIGELRAELVGMPLTSNISNLGEFLTQRVHDDLGIPVILGGIDPTLHPDKAIEAADFVCVGEGEYAVAELVEALDGGNRAPEIEGIWTRRPDGSVYRGKVRRLITDLDALPYCDWDPASEFWIFNDEMGDGFMPPRYSCVHREVPLMTQRGCPYACTYCYSSQLRAHYPGQQFVRRRSVDHVMGELHMLRERFPHMEQFFFYDDVFTLHPRWIEEFAPRYKREIGTRFGIFTFPKQCRRRTLEPLRDAGMFEVRIGIQSGSERTLRHCYNRQVSPARMLEAAKLIRELGMDIIIDLIACNLDEDEADHRATFELLLSLPKPFRISAVNPLTYYDGLPITDQAIAKGHRLTPPTGGGNKFEQQVSAEMRFWMILFGLTMFDLDPDKILRPLADDTYLRQNPEALEHLRLTLYNLSYADGAVAEKPKDAEIAALRQSVADLQQNLAWWHGRAARPLWRKTIDKLLGR